MIGCRPTPDAEYGEIVRKGKETEEWSVELPEKYHPSLAKKALFTDKNSTHEGFYLHGIHTKTSKLPPITSPIARSLYTRVVLSDETKI